MTDERIAAARWGLYLLGRIAENISPEIGDQMPTQDNRNWPEFQRELASLINKHSLERASNLPDWVLAEYLTRCLVALNTATLQTRPVASNVVSLGK